MMAGRRRRGRGGLILLCLLLPLGLMGAAAVHRSRAGWRLPAPQAALHSTQIALAGVVGGLFGAKPPEQVFVPTTTVENGSFDVSLIAVGSLKSKENQPVVSDAYGTVVWAVEDGTRVKKGDPIVQLQNDQLVRQLQDKDTALANAKQTLADTKRDRTLEWENAKTDWLQAEQELEILKAQDKSTLEQSQAQLEFKNTDLALSRVTYTKDQRLADEKLVPQTQADADAAAAKAKEFDYEKAKGDLDLQKGQLAGGELTKQQDVDRLKFAADMARNRIDSEVKNAQLNVDTIQKQKDDLIDQIKKSVIAAPSDGIVVLATSRDDDNVRPLQPGDQVGRSQKVADMPDLAHMQVALEVEQKDIGPIRVGLPVRIHLDPFPGIVYHGRVVEVAQVAKPSQIEGSWWDANKNTFTTLIDIQENDPHRLRPGMNATLEIYSSSLSHVTSIPLEALYHRDGQPIAYLQQGSQFKAVSLELGPRNKDRVVIRKGLSPGQQIALVPPAPTAVVNAEGPAIARAPAASLTHHSPLATHQ